MRHKTKYEDDYALGATCKAYGRMLTGIRGGVCWSPRMSSPVRKAHDLNNQSPIPSGLHNQHIAFLPRGLECLVKGLG